MNLYKLKNKEGFELEICSIGMSIKKLQLPWGINPIVGYLNSEEYLNNSTYQGCIVGRTTNRIEKSELIIDSKTITLSNNEGIHHLHGGKEGLHLANWTIVQSDTEIKGTYISEEGESGYSGKVYLETTIKLVDNKLIINYRAFCNQKSPLSLTHHPYFSFGNDYKNLDFTIFANEFLETTEDLLPTGVILPVTEFELKAGIDTCFVQRPNSSIQKNAEIIDKDSNTTVIISSDYPAFQVYTSTNEQMNVSVPKGNVCICIEPQFMTGFTKFTDFTGFFFDGENEYYQTIIYEFLNQ